MGFDPERHHRRSIRWHGHDYAAGGTYFVTICTEGRACLFGEVREAEMHVNAIGLIVEREWMRTGQVRPEVEVDVFGLMPNHLHGLVTINPVEDGDVPRGTRIPEGDVATSSSAQGRGAHGDQAHSGVPLRRARSLSSIFGQFTATSTLVINEARGTPGARVWQRGFYEHVVRDGDDFERIAWYIVTNPERWETDDENPHR
jgi:putative transposase